MLIIENKKGRMFFFTEIELGNKFNKIRDSFHQGEWFKVASPYIQHHHLDYGNRQRFHKIHSFYINQSQVT
jgi:hypothetical protein